MKDLERAQAAVELDHAIFDMQGAEHAVESIMDVYSNLPIEWDFFRAAVKDLREARYAFQKCLIVIDEGE